MCVGGGGVCEALCHPCTNTFCLSLSPVHELLDYEIKSTGVASNRIILGEQLSPLQYSKARVLEIPVWGEATNIGGSYGMPILEALFVEEVWSITPPPSSSPTLYGCLPLQVGSHKVAVWLSTLASPTPSLWVD